MNLLSVPLALAAAISNAASNVLQRKANLDERSGQALSVRLLWRLLHNKIWLTGLLTVTLSFVLQAAALGTGTLAGVQPIIVLELPFTLLAASWVLGSSLHHREWTSIGAMTAGLACLLVSLDPQPAKSFSVTSTTWLVGSLSTLGVLALLLLSGRRRSGPARAALFGCATGIEFGFTAALMKGTTEAFSGGIVGVLSSWTTYATVAAGIFGMFLMQNALQAGKLVSAQPGITLLDPVTAILWGALAFHERLNQGPWWAMATAGAGVMALGALVLGGSPALTEEHDDETAPEPAGLGHAGGRDGKPVLRLEGISPGRRSAARDALDTGARAGASG